MTRGRSMTLLAASVLVCVLVGVSASWVTSTSVRNWYPGLAKPSWTPPGAVFGPVWTALYILMGVAFWMIRERGEPGPRRVATALFALQLLLNAAWSFVFFGLRSPGGALIEIAFLWLAIVATILAFARLRRSAAALLAPYLAWVSFAAALNASIWMLNR